VAAVEVLFTSLLVQAQVALRAEAATAPPGSRVRSRSFRSSFLLAYTHRIGDRLDAVNQSVRAGAVDDDRSLLPVLAARDDAVEDAVEEQFGPLQQSSVSGGTDGLGWTRGELAADRAQLHHGDLDGSLPEVS
jgi:hypothetical protein